MPALCWVLAWWHGVIPGQKWERHGVTACREAETQFFFFFNILLKGLRLTDRLVAEDSELGCPPGMLLCARLLAPRGPCNTLGVQERIPRFSPCLPATETRPRRMYGATKDNSCKVPMSWSVSLWPVHPLVPGFGEHRWGWSWGWREEL